MQIIFESAEERDRFFDNFCMDSKAWESMKISNGIGERYCGVHNCRECWEKSGLKYDIISSLHMEPYCIQTKDGLAYCQDCEYEDVHEFDEPCRSCGPDHCNFEPKEAK